jgi:hypothetical protein
LYFEAKLMTHVTVSVKKWGNSLGILLPKEIVEETDVSEEDIVDIHIVKKKKATGFGLCRGASPFIEDDDSHADIA